MIKRHELTDETRAWLTALEPQEQDQVLDLATDAMLAMEQRAQSRIRRRAGLGENGSVELVLKMILFFNTPERGTCHEQ